MSFLDKIQFWKKTTPILAEAKIKLTTPEMLIVEQIAHKYGLSGGLTALTPDQYKMILPDLKVYESYSSYNQSNDSKVSSSQVAAALAVIYTKATENRKQMFLEVDEMSQFYLVDIIISQLADDALNPDVTTDEIFQLTCDDKVVFEELKLLEKKFKLDKMVKELIPDILRYGEYTLATVLKTHDDVSNSNTLESLHEAKDKKDFEKSETGLVQLNDGVDQTEVIAICKNTEVDYYLNVTERNQRLNLERKPKTAYVQFRLESERIRIDFNKQFNNLTPGQKAELAKLPRFVRLGKSFIHSMIPKIKELELLEKLAPATRLSELAAGTLIGVQVPTGYNLEDGRKAAEAIESMINRKLNVNDEQGRISVEAILTSVGRTKVVPLFGDNGKTSVMETKSQAPNSLTADITTLRKVILDGIGIPYELVFSSDGATKSEILKRYSRYLRKLKAIQHTVKDGLLQIACIHLAAKGISFDPDKIEVNFHNKLIELDNLDKLEFVDGSISLLTNTKAFIDDLLGSEQLGPHVDMDEFVTYLRDQLRLLGLEDLVLLKPKKVPKLLDTDPLTTDPTDALDPSGDTGSQMPNDSTSDHSKTSLNGSQVTSMLNIIGQVANRLIPRETGIQLLIAAFSLDQETADGILGDIGTSFFAPEMPDKTPVKPEKAPNALPVGSD